MNSLQLVNPHWKLLSNKDPPSFFWREIIHSKIESTISSNFTPSTLFSESEVTRQTHAWNWHRNFAETNFREQHHTNPGYFVWANTVMWLVLCQFAYVIVIVRGISQNSFSKRIKWFDDRYRIISFLHGCNKDTKTYKWTNSLNPHDNVKKRTMKVTCLWVQRNQVGLCHLCVSEQKFTNLFRRCTKND